MKNLLVVIICIFVIICMLSSCCQYNDSYFKEINWNCDKNTFLSYYDNLYSSKILELKQDYNLQYQEKKHIEDKGQQGVEICYYLYCGNFTIRLEMYNGKEHGVCQAYLYYYSENISLNEYEKVEPLVNFINDFINYVSYDAKNDTNHFETLYFEALHRESFFAKEELHFDHAVGSLYYLVDLYGSSDTGGYYYMMEKNTSLQKECYRFEFEGLLKPIS